MGPPSSRSAQEGEAARGATAELKWPLFADARHVEENGEGMGERGDRGVRLGFQGRQMEHGVLTNDLDED